MESELRHYSSGEDIEIGDRVRYGGTFATVVVVSDGETYQLASGYEDHAGAERGLMICDDDGALTSIDDTDERLIFVERGTADPQPREGERPREPCPLDSWTRGTLALPVLSG